MSQERVVVAMTCHNRREQTLACLRTVAAQTVGRAVEVVLVDDGSTDGTAAAVAREFPRVNVVQGDGQLYWAGGMRLALERAAQQEPDYLLWLNDDVLLRPDALRTLLDAAQHDRTAIVVGSVGEEASALTTYGGIRSRWSRVPLQLRLVQATAETTHVDSFNGNVALVPTAVYRALGGLDRSFKHGLADWDFGLRASKAGYPVIVAAGLVGWCSKNDARGTYGDPGLRLGRRLRLLTSTKGLPPGSWWTYCKRHAGWLAPAFWLSPYVYVLRSHIRHRLGRTST